MLRIDPPSAGSPIRMLLALLAAFQTAGVTADEAEPARFYAGPPEKLHIYILVGQSNMSGRAAIGAEDRAPLASVYVLDGEHRWRPASHPFNQYTTVPSGRDKVANGLNLGDAFARALRAHDPEISLGLIVNAQGGSSIKAWLPGKGDTNYDRTLVRIKAARGTGVLKGVLWHQGEADIKELDAYQGQLETVIANFRRDLEAPQLPFLAGQLALLPEQRAFNERLLALPQRVPHTAVVRSDGTAGDIHFDAPSTRLLGKRYAEALLKLRAAQP